MEDLLALIHEVPDRRETVPRRQSECIEHYNDDVVISQRARCNERWR